MCCKVGSHIPDIAFCYRKESQHEFVFKWVIRSQLTDSLYAVPRNLAGVRPESVPRTSGQERKEQRRVTPTACASHLSCLFRVRTCLSQLRAGWTARSCLRGWAGRYFWGHFWVRKERPDSQETRMVPCLL
jgi:hypothetical protein